MKSIDVISERQGNIAYTRVNIGNLLAVVEQVGDVKTITTHGRGNIRQLKEIARKIHKAIA